MIHNYEDFCKYYDAGRLKPDVNSTLGFKTVETLRELGWEIRKEGFFSKSRVAKDLLAICRKSEENFKFAHSAGIDFWVD